MSNLDFEFAEEEVKAIVKDIKENLKRIEKIIEREQIRLNYLSPYAYEPNRKSYCCVCGKILSSSESEYIDLSKYGKRICKEHGKEISDSLKVDESIAYNLAFECPNCKGYSEEYDFGSTPYSVKPFKCKRCGYQCGVIYHKGDTVVYYIHNLPISLFSDVKEVPNEYV